MAKQEKPKQKKSDRIIGRRYRYTKDYEIVPAIGANGRRQKQLLYTADWILPANEPEEYKALVLRMRILLALSVAAVLCATQALPAPMTNKWYLPVLMVSVFPLAYQIMSAVRLPAQKKRMERQEFDKGFVRLGHCAMFAFVVICAAALGLLVYWIVAAATELEGEAPYSLRDGLFAALLALAAAAELLLWRLCRQIRPETVPNAVRED